VNVGSEHEKKELKIGVQITTNERDGIISLLREFSDVFAYTCVDMLGLDASIVVHMLPLIGECKPVQQKLRRMRLDILIKVKEEVRKQ
jgi:hypothetical protein